jgi:hypothetical protein
LEPSAAARYVEATPETRWDRIRDDSGVRVALDHLIAFLEHPLAEAGFDAEQVALSL